jgi:hypothetical protein
MSRMFVEAATAIVAADAEAVAAEETTARRTTADPHNRNIRSSNARKIRPHRLGRQIHPLIRQTCLQRSRMRMRKTAAHPPAMSANRKEKRAISLAAAAAVVGAVIAAAAKKPKLPAAVQRQPGQTRMSNPMSRTNRTSRRWNRMRSKRSMTKLISR